MLVVTLLVCSIYQGHRSLEVQQIIGAVCDNATNAPELLLKAISKDQQSDIDDLKRLAILCREAGMYDASLSQLSLLGKACDGRDGLQGYVAWSLLATAEVFHERGDHECSREHYQLYCDRYAGTPYYAVDIASRIAPIPSEGRCIRIPVTAACPSAPRACLSTSVVSVLRFWKSDCSEREIHKALDAESGHIDLSTVVERVPDIADMEAIPFIASKDIIIGLLELGCPVIIQYDDVDDRDQFYHATVIDAYCEFERRYMVQDPNWLAGWGSLPQGKVEGLRAVALAPRGVLDPLRPHMGGATEAALLLDLGDDLLLSGAYEDAEFVYSVVKLKRPAWGAYGLFTCAFAKDRLEDAQRYLEEALREPPFRESPNQWLYLAEMYAKSGVMDKAVDASLRAIECGSRCYLAYQTLAYLLMENQENAAALGCCEAIQRLWPGDVWTAQMMSFIGVIAD